MRDFTGTIQMFDYLYNRPWQISESGPGPGGKRTEAERKKESLQSCHRDSKGQLIVQAEAFHQSIMAGAKMAGLKYGKQSLSKHLEASLFIEDLYWGCRTPDSIFAHWGKVPPRTGGAVMIYRPMMKAGRKLDFKIHVLDDNIQVEQIRSAIITAGGVVGMGSWRPRFGRFELLKFAQTKGRKA